MSKYQLWSRDEYGQGSIIFTSEDVGAVIKRGKEEVTKLNVSNALTADDRERNWEAYMVNITSESKKKIKYVYGGPYAQATDTIYSFGAKNEDTDTVKLGEIPKAVVRIYLGNISVDRHKEEDWFASDVGRKQIIDKINHQDLEGKTIFFVKKI